jgi:hypothetical protein
MGVAAGGVGATARCAALTVASRQGPGPSCDPLKLCGLRRFWDRVARSDGDVFQILTRSAVNQTLGRPNLLIPPLQGDMHEGSSQLGRIDLRTSYCTNGEPPDTPGLFSLVSVGATATIRVAERTRCRRSRAIAAPGRWRYFRTVTNSDLAQNTDRRIFRTPAR